MQIHQIIQELEQWAPLAYQEDYDNCGLLVGDRLQACSGILISLDVTESVLEEAITKKANLIVAHHPFIFRGLKQINGNRSIDRILIQAIKHDIVIYAIHTNLDNIFEGVNKAIAEKIGLEKLNILQPKSGLLRKLSTFVPPSHKEIVLNALFDAGAGHVGDYSECSFIMSGIGTFLPNEGTRPFSGSIGTRSNDPEEKIEVIFQKDGEKRVIQALFNSHPYEEVAYDIVNLSNDYQKVGSGMTGTLPEPVDELQFLRHLQQCFGTAVIRHSPLLGKKISKVAVCGGAGVFMTSKAIQSGADILVTADIKYHDFFDAEGKLILADIGHWESEQYTIDLISAFLSKKFPTFAVLKTEVQTNPVRYFV
ncbi:MAG: Nif3-like dinuclear metal center hexameric protein [Bacteroidota bacterium]|jgi:dinuclear metal center YbgI/SA1388 family protein